MKILISGASRGIGAALALEYAKKGCDIFLTASTESDLKSVCKECESFGVKASYGLCDVRNKSSVARVFTQALDNLGSIDIAILNAGVSGSDNFKNLQSAELIRIFETNVFGVVFFLELLTPYFIEQGSGTIVGVSSLADSRGYPGSGAYCASKSALTKILESARNDLKPIGIKVITVKPGFVKTAMTDKNKFPMPFMMPADKAAKIISSGVARGKKEIRFPGILSVLSKLAEFVPNAIYDGLIRKVKREKPNL